MARRPWIGGNWKCNGNKAQVQELAKAFNAYQFDEAKMDVVICPPAPYLSFTKTELQGRFKVAAQNISRTGNGAYTGEVSADMLKDLELKWTLIGHSERRQYYHEQDDEVAEKVAITQKAEINAIVCIGETLSEREANKTNDVLKRQMEAVIPAVKNWDLIVIAYEPVWAIGTGKVATTEQAEDAHKVIRDLVAKSTTDAVAKSVRIVYGGSVNDKNCKELAKQEDIDGFLVGGASLKPSFTDIMDSFTA